MTTITEATMVPVLSDEAEKIYKTIHVTHNYRYDGNKNTHKYKWLKSKLTLVCLLLSTVHSDCIAYVIQGKNALLSFKSL